MTDKINIVCLHGFFANTGSADALTITGDAETVILTKRGQFAGWLTDTTTIVVDEGETTVCEENVRQVLKLVEKWLRGEEVDI